MAKARCIGLRSGADPHGWYHRQRLGYVSRELARVLGVRPNRAFASTRELISTRTWPWRRSCSTFLNTGCAPRKPRDRAQSFPHSVSLDWRSPDPENERHSPGHAVDGAEHRTAGDPDRREPGLQSRCGFQVGAMRNRDLLACLILIVFRATSCDAQTGPVFTNVLDIKAHELGAPERAP